MRKKFGLVLTALSLMLATFVNIVPVKAAADTCTWTGATDANLTGTNWSGCDNGNVPESGDTLVFPESASNKTLVIDGFAVSPQFINITGSGYSFTRTDATVLEVDGPSFGITTTQNVTFNVPVNFGNTGTNSFNHASTGTTATFNNTVNIAASGEVNIGSSGNTGTFDFVGNVTGSTTQFIAVNGATAILRGTANTYTATTVGAESAGIFECQHSTCFGDNANNIYMGNGDVELHVSAVYSNDVETSTSSAGDSRLFAYENISITGSVTVNDALAIYQYGSGAKSLQFNGSAMTLNENISVFGNNSTNSTVRLNLNVSGAGGMSVADVFLELTNGNTFMDTVFVNSGAVVSVESTSALGDSSVSGVVLDGGSIIFDGLGGAATIPNPFSIAGDGLAGEGALRLIADTNLTLTGDITLTADATIGADNPCGLTKNIDLDGVISGTGDLTTYASNIPCGVTIGGASPNTWTGDLIHLSGYMYLEKDTSVTGNAILAPNGSTASTFIRIESSVTDAITGGAVAVGPTSSNEYFNFLNNETVASFSANGPSSTLVCQGSTLIVNQTSNTTYAGTFGNAGGCPVVGDRVIDKQGAGTLTISLDDASDTTTSFDVSAGNLVVNANRSGTDVTISGGTLKGSGTVGAVTGTSGRFNAGTSPGCVTVGSLTMSSGFDFDVEINGTTACTQYDRTTSTGAVNLGSADLNVALGYTPSDGTVFTIINAGSLSGTFSGLAEGSTLTVNGVQFRVNYTSTSVTLTKLTGSLSTTGQGIINTAIFALGFILLAILLSYRPKKGGRNG